MLSDIGFILGTTLMYATPLIYAALGAAISENSGVVNLGLEGMMYMGAFIGATVGYYLGNPWIAFLAAGAVGALVACLHGIACISFNADHVVSGIAINFFSIGFALFLCRIFFDGATMSLSLNFDQKMPRPFNGAFEPNSFGDLVFNQYATVYLAFILVLIVWYLLYKTRIGLRIRSVGEHPKAADTLGINVSRVRYLAVILSGVFAGFGGAAMSIAIVSRFSPTLISGHGFIAIAAMIFGKWKPQGAMLACLLFGSAKGFEIFLGASGLEIDLGIFKIGMSSQILAMLPYAVTLVVLVGFVGKAVAPSAVGLQYEKEA
ncbi:MAG: ABC transporter permease [Desulfobacteraceae bacterium]|nr:ABC transporter permease [Desulfobacteraceae bacterium]